MAKKQTKQKTPTLNIIKINKCIRKHNINM